MASDKKQPKAKKTQARAAQPAPQPSAAHPADGELRFQHVIRNMVVAREEARKSRG